MRQRTPRRRAGCRPQFKKERSLPTLTVVAAGWSTWLPLKPTRPTKSGGGWARGQQLLALRCHMRCFLLTSRRRCRPTSCVPTPRRLTLPSHSPPAPTSPGRSSLAGRPRPFDLPGADATSERIYASIYQSYRRGFAKTGRATTRSPCGTCSTRSLGRVAHRAERITRSTGRSEDLILIDTLEYKKLSTRRVKRYRCDVRDKTANGSLVLQLAAAAVDHVCNLRILRAFVNRRSCLD